MDITGLVGYPNVPQSIGIVMSANMATLHQLQTDLSAFDVYLMLEVIAVDANNKRVAEQFYRDNPDR